MSTKEEKRKRGKEEKRETREQRKKGWVQTHSPHDLVISLLMGSLM
jgi:hypothetical protein